ncbi:MAG: alpha-amylase [Cyclobacteriaceae bacterium]|nr:alpha-amylase [Cyclobacteriaceae bacterium]
MNKYIIVLCVFAACLYSCQTKTSNDVPSSTSKGITFPEKVADGTIYEVNIRQHTKEGTINAFAKDLPRLKDLGVKMLWIMPVQPIGVLKRKEPLGSYYSISDYKKVNPEFGTDEDFKNLVTKTHELGMYLILDWVPNHTAWDHPWITEHPDYYAHDEKGNIAHESDWDDIALLDHTNPGARSLMISDMKYWVTNFDIDGFRCDHAGHEIPLYFWEEARTAIDPEKDIFWLAEWDGARMHLQFDATYAWPLLTIQDKVGKGEANANDLAKWIADDLKEYGQKPFRMTMITNHDENSWHGTEFERYGDGAKTFATFIFTAYGVPMLYSGQDAGLDKRLKFFSKDSIDWSDPKQFQPFYKKLISLHKDNKALWAGEYGAMPVRINDADPNVYAFQRTKENNSVISVLNFSGKPQELRIKDEKAAGTYKDYFTGESFELSAAKPLKLTPWQYLVFVR